MTIFATREAEKELIADQLRRGVSASEVMAGVRARAAAAISEPAPEDDPNEIDEPTTEET